MYRSCFSEGTHKRGDERNQVHILSNPTNFDLLPWGTGTLALPTKILNLLIDESSIATKVLAPLTAKHMVAH